MASVNPSKERMYFNDKCSSVILMLCTMDKAKLDWTKIKIFITIIIKSSSTGQSRKNYIDYKLLSQPHKNLRHRKLKNKLMEATNDWLLPQIQLTFQHQTQCRGHSSHDWAGRKHLTNWDVRCLDTSNSNGWAAAAAWVSQTLTEADGSSLNKQWFEFELTCITYTV